MSVYMSTCVYLYVDMCCEFGDRLRIIAARVLEFGGLRSATQSSYRDFGCFFVRSFSSAVGLLHFAVGSYTKHIRVLQSWCD